MNVSAISSNLTGSISSLESLDSKSKPTTAQEAEQRHKAAGQFEAILVRQLLSKSVGSMLGGMDNVSGSVYGDMMTDVLAQNLTSGQGLGLGKMIEQQLTPRTAAHAAPTHLKKS